MSSSPMVNLFFLKTFVDAAKTGSVKNAALKNYVTQPAVTQHIRLLEEKLKCRFFERHNKKIHLTPCGKIFLDYAETILKKYEEAQMRLAEFNKQFTGTVRIATIYSIGLYQLQPIVRNFLKKFPNIDIHLEYQPFDKIYEMVGNQTIDFGFVAYPKPKSGCSNEIFTEEKLVAAQSPDHPILKKKRASLNDLNQIKFVSFSSETPTRNAIDHFLKSKGIHPIIVNEYDDIETLKSAVQLGIGCSILPQNTLTHELKDGTLEMISIHGLDLTRPLGILYPKGKTFPKPIKVFHELVIKS